ncbi:MAG: sulfur carrier protein ThiS [Clostridia bacterium]|nr:sulfur carrier protein ThiS [Clostridia bacterium]
MVKVRVNGEGIEVQEGTTLLDYLQQKGVNPQLVVVEYNREIVKRDTWHEVVLQEGDKIEILAFVGGG